jgi:hypothetical protein
MSKASKSPKRVIKAAYEVGKEAFSDYSHRCSPQKFTQPQLFACLVLKAFFQTDYRGIEEILQDCPDWAGEIELEEIPHFTTLQKAEKRLLNKASTRKILVETIRKALTNRQMKRIVELAAIDGSGFESRHVSDYFMKRQNMTGQRVRHIRYPKANLLCDCSSHMTLAIDVCRGPSPDIVKFCQVLGEAIKNIKIKTLLADAGYDSERSHVFAREELGIRSIIPPLIGRRTSKLPKGRWRRLMRQRFDEEKYGQRWQVETVFSMIKRKLGSALTARNYHSQCRELRLKAITLNIMIIAAFLLLRFY